MTMESRAASTPLTDTRPRPDPATIAPVVQIDRAAVQIGGRVIWHDVSLDVAPGEFIAILGPNGAGKSTLLKAILGLLPISEGSLSVLDSSPRRARHAIGYVPQRRSFGDDVRVRGRDVVRLGLDGTRWGIPLPGLLHERGGRREARERVQAVIDLVGASTYADRSIGELSGGEQQRLLVAQALVTRPRILLLDEPLDGLDLRHQQEVSAVIRSISAQSETAVLLVAHDVNPLLQHVDRLCYIAQGHMAVGRPDEIITSETLTQLYGSYVEVLRTKDGRLVVVGQPEGVPCTDYHPHGVH